MNKVKICKKKLSAIRRMESVAYWSLEEIEDQLLRIEPKLPKRIMRHNKRMAFSTIKSIVMWKDKYEVYFGNVNELRLARDLLIAQEFSNYEEMREFLSENGVKVHFPSYHLRITEENEMIMINVQLRLEDKIEENYPCLWKMHKGGKLS